MAMKKGAPALDLPVKHWVCFGKNAGQGVGVG
jgi:hypothetical protein